MTEQVPFLVSSPTNLLTLQDVILDSPVWRANVLHLEEQIDQFEKWIDGFTRALKNYIEAINKHNTQASTLCKRTFFSGLDGTLIDNKMAGNVVTTFATTLQSTIAYKMKLASDLQDILLSPLQQLMKHDLKTFKESRKQFEKTLDKYETQLNRYNVLSKQKEASALREDAFQMYEMRKLYVKSSSDHFTKLVSFKANLEIVLIECFSGALRSHIEDIDESAYSCTAARSKLDGWKQWLDESKLTSKYQLNKVQRRCTELQELYMAQVKPHRSLKKYSTAANDPMLAVSPSSHTTMDSGDEETAPTLSSTLAAKQLNPNTMGVSRKASKGKQGYLNSRIMNGKSRSPWVRRWFFLQEGWLGTCTVSTIHKEKGCIVLGDRIRISECIFRVCTDLDRRYCFEVTHPKCNFFLQAETEQDMQQWLWSIEYNMQHHEARPLPTSPQLLLSPKAALMNDQIHKEEQDDSSPRLVAMSTSPLPSPDGSQQKNLTPILSTTASSLTTLMIREGNHTKAIDIKQPQHQDSSKSHASTSSISGSSWNMPWLTSGINAFSNSEEDLHQNVSDNSNSTSSSNELIVWPNKLETDAPKPALFHYSARLETAQKELRKLFYNVPQDDIVIETFPASLYRAPSTGNSDDAITTTGKSTTYGYHGTAYLTRRNLWFYSCTLMTCVNMIVIPLHKVHSVTIENTAHSNGMLMLIEANVSEQKQIIRFGLWLESADVIAEKLKQAVSNATSHDPQDTQQLYDTIRNITCAKLQKNKTPASHVTTSSALYASVTPLTVQAQPVMMQPNASSSATTHAPDDTDDGNDNQQHQKLSDEETSQATPPSVHRGSPAQGALAAVAARSQKNFSVLKSGTTPSSTPRVSTPRMSSQDQEHDLPSHVQQPAEKVNCNCTQHLDKVEADVVLHANAKQVFDLLFKHSDIWTQLNESKNYGPPTVSEWQDNKRTLQYSMPVSNPMVKAKETDVTETQEIIRQKEYTCYVVSVTTKTPNLPYADAFVPTVRYCITYETASTCRLVCSLGVEWLRSIFVKSMVNRAATKGMQETIAGVLPIVQQAFSRQQRQAHAATTQPPLTPPPANRLKSLPSTTDEHRGQMKRAPFVSIVSFVLACVCILFTVYQLVIQQRYQHFLDTNNQMTITWRGVYLKDIQHAVEREVGLDKVNQSIYGDFQATRQGITHYNYAWSSKQHRWMAAELGYSRERLGAIRYELLSTFRVLNQVEYQLLETEYWNWISDRQLDCTDDCDALLKEMSSSSSSS
ncbi:Glutaredoxin [Mucor velutinosus]|uniref:Glutaredoxin n=1 Tax=Mucor velutinosus TaxID=708070 RepID=A0AAN7D8T3_9FUNG|nr:Glutaredoxin [Mucor velutinosus]